MFWLTNHHQEAYCCTLLKLCLLKYSVKICHYEFSAVMWLHNYPVLLVCVLYAVQNALRTAHTPIGLGNYAVYGAFCIAYSTQTSIGLGNYAAT